MISNWCTDIRFLTMDGSQAIRARIAAADDDYAFTGCENFRCRVGESPRQRLFCWGRNSIAK